MNSSEGILNAMDFFLPKINYLIRGEIFSPYRNFSIAIMRGIFWEISFSEGWVKFADFYVEKSFLSQKFFAKKE